MDFIALLKSWGLFASPLWWVNLLWVIAISVVGELLVRFLILESLSRLVRRTKATWDDIVFDHHVMNYAAHLVTPLLLYVLLPVVADDFLLHLLRRVCHIVTIVYLMLFVNSMLDAGYQIYSQSRRFKGRPLKGLLQSLQVILISIGVIWVVSILINKSPVVLFTGLGASAAVLMLVFKDSIMGFVSGIQLSANDMLKVGDWIVMPKYGADGEVLEVTLNTVKVRNWDNTIVTLPPYALISDSFQNYRGMSESGGRRIKRAINIDMNSVRFCTPEMLERYRKIDLVKAYVEDTERRMKEYNADKGIDGSVPANGRRQTNLGVFRAYLTLYLRSLPEVNQQMTCMVRQLPPTDKGIPMELYFFSAIKEWVPYEGIQSDIFDHVLAVVQEFDLRVFQSPSGFDLNNYTEKM